MYYVWFFFVFPNTIPWKSIGSFLNVVPLVGFFHPHDVSGSFSLPPLPPTCSLGMNLNDDYIATVQLGWVTLLPSLPTYKRPVFVSRQWLDYYFLSSGLYRWL